MIPDTITQRIHDRSDAELRKELKAFTTKIWDEACPHSSERPALDDWPGLSESVRKHNLFKNEETPWIGAVAEAYVELAFAHIAPKRRANALHDFMKKVESVSEITNQQQEIP